MELSSIINEYPYTQELADKFAFYGFNQVPECYKVVNQKPKSGYYFTEKSLDAIALGAKSYVHFHVYEGSARSSKTVSAIQEFYYAVLKSETKLHCIAGRTADSIRENILDSDFGLLRIFDNVEIITPKIGGHYVRILHKRGDKIIEKHVLLASYDNKNTWKKVLGNTLGVVLIDEINIANEQFIDEVFARQMSVRDCLVIATLNGDVPTLPVYTKYINRCNIIGTAPVSVRTDMDKYEKEPGWFYQHFTMFDNPIMTPDLLLRNLKVYPRSSFYFRSKILGERGTPGKLIYAEYMSEEKNIEDLAQQRFYEYCVGVDIGATRATNSISLIGITGDYQRIAVVDKVQIKQCGYDEKAKILLETILGWKNLGRKIYAISVDSAEQNFIKDLVTLFKRYNLTVVPSYKATIKERIDLGIILLASGRLVFNNSVTGRDAFNCFLQACWVEGKEGIEREDKNLPHNDAIDSIEYALTLRMNTILSSQKWLEGGK